jgi:hypothetical protein
MPASPHQFPDLAIGQRNRAIGAGHLLGDRFRRVHLGARGFLILQLQFLS